MISLMWNFGPAGAGTSSCKLMIKFGSSMYTGPTLEGLRCLTHWGQNKTSAILQTTLSNAFSWMKMFEFTLKFQWCLFLRVQLIIFQHWFRWWLGAGQATSHCLNQWWLVYWCIDASLGLNELSFWMTSNLIYWTPHVDLKDMYLNAVICHSSSLGVI